MRGAGGTVARLADWRLSACAGGQWGGVLPGSAVGCRPGRSGPRAGRLRPDLPGNRSYRGRDAARVSARPLEIDLGAFDERTFCRLAAALQRWQPQRGAGFTIVPGGHVTAGLTFALVVPLPVGYVTGAGRVVYVTDEPEGYGFAYGTLPVHPEQGEEAFHIASRGGRLVFTVTAFSRPRHPAARIGGPLTRALQLRANRSYLAAMRRVALAPP